MREEGDMGDTKEAEASMKESNHLAGLFQKIVEDCKVGDSLPSLAT